MRVLVATLLALGLSLVGAPAHAVDVDRDAPPVLHRVVWASAARANPGIHIRSMERDGSDVRQAYDWPHGFTLDLSLDPAGRRVAFAPCCRATLPLLVVAPVLGGKPREPLRKTGQFDAIGGIGWSPNGKRLAFEGFSGPSEARVTTIWTVRPNGKGLRKVLAIPSAGFEQLVSNRFLAWTSEGILYSDGEDLRSARAGRSTLVMRHVRGVRVSGDGRRLVLERVRGDTGSVWLSDSDGTHRRKLLVQGGGDGTEYYFISPSYDAKELLATRRSAGSEEQLVTWRVSDGPGRSSVLTLPEPFTVGATWN